MRCFGALLGGEKHSLSPIVRTPLLIRVGRPNTQHAPRISCGRLEPYEQITLTTVMMYIELLPNVISLIVLILFPESHRGLVAERILHVDHHLKGSNRQGVQQRDESLYCLTCSQRTSPSGEGSSVTITLHLQ